MAAKHDIQRGIDATIAGSREQVIEALQRAADVVGEHERLEVRLTDKGSQVRAAYLAKPLLIKSAAASCHWVMVISLEDVGGQQVLTTHLDEYKVRQDKILGFIPAGPQTLVGRPPFITYLDALEGELRALDPAADIAQREPR